MRVQVWVNIKRERKCQFGNRPLSITIHMALFCCCSFSISAGCFTFVNNSMPHWVKLIAGMLLWTNRWPCLTRFNLWKQLPQLLQYWSTFNLNWLHICEQQFSSWLCYYALYCSSRLKFTPSMSQSNDVLISPHNVFILNGSHLLLVKRCGQCE